MLTYEKYDKNRLAVHGSKQIYGKDMIKLGCRWNPRLKGGEGWFLPISKEVELLQIIANYKDNIGTDIDTEKTNQKLTLKIMI